MALFTTNINFRFPWRPYQKRVLDNLEDYLEDKQLHIVAPPGSGKTVLGLEVVKRLNKPALILAPTITIRNQWADRLIVDFLDNQPFPHLSFDIKKADKLTISTYQGLHFAFKDNPEKLIDDLRKQGIKNLVVDECHHLKNEWWKTLFHLNEKLNLQIIALTATPPFDVSGTEWQRYHQLCGEVDAEINVAELVAEHNLCPHQDYIYFSLPTNDESIEITRFHNDVNDFIDDLKINFTFRDWIKHHPFLQEPEQHLDTIYETPDYFSSLLIVNEFFNGSVPLGTTEIIGGDIENLPNMDEEWLQLFLNHALFKDYYFLQFEKKETFKAIIKTLKKIGAIERKKVALLEPENINKKLRLSTSKLNSITTIVQHEWETLKDDLRMVILTDYIRKEEMPTSEMSVKNQEKIGVVPIFERLRKRFPIEVDLGVLTGSLVIIPKIALEQLERIIVEKKLHVSQLNTKSLPHTDDYLQVETSGELRTKIVEVITELFTKGGITTLVGTKSLLGEGWDAPAVNSLVLATFVGSYVLSNQMRGRAIRTQKGNDDKTANIWHLVCLDPTDKYGGHDFQILKRRFKAFHGVGFSSQPMIENGMNRFLLPPFPIDANSMNTINNQMLNRADNRERLRLDWEKALGNGMLMVEEIKVPIVRQKSYKNIKSNLTKTLETGFYLDLEAILEAIKKQHFVAIILSVIAYISLPIWGIWLLIFTSFISNYLFYQVTIYYKVVFNLYNFLQPLVPTIKNNIQPFWKKINQYGQIILVLGAIISIVLNWSAILFIVALYTLIINIALFKNLKKNPLYSASSQIRNIIFDEAKFIQELGNIILKTLSYINYILPSDFNKINVRTDIDEFGEVVCYLEEATTFQNELFLEALSEVINPIENPRYLIRVDRDAIQQYDEPFYATIPSLFSKRKADAEAFAFYWNETLTMNNLVYTRTQEGRLELLKARNMSLNPEFHPKAERLSAWR
ncbi:MAG: DEAD/DEAH box helicase family protein [Saprospiraceae bacterium]